MEKDRNYIGKGTQVKEFDMVEVSINLDEAEKFAFTYEENGKRYLKFTLAKLKKADQFGKTHTAYIDVLPPKEEKKGKKK